jgi:hypothetical protein
MELLAQILGLFVLAAVWGLLTRAADSQPINQR